MRALEVERTPAALEEIDAVAAVATAMGDRYNEASMRAIKG